MDNMVKSGYRCKTGESLDNDKQRFYKSQQFLAIVRSGAKSCFVNEGGYKGNRYKLGGMPFITKKDGVKTLWNYGVPLFSIWQGQPVYHLKHDHPSWTDLKRGAWLFSDEGIPHSFCTPEGLQREVKNGGIRYISQDDVKDFLQYPRPKK